MGLHFPGTRRRDLEKGIRSASRDLGFADPESCIESLLSSPWRKDRVETLAGHLTVGETYFFRDPKMFETLETKVIPPLLRSRRGERRLKLWSAGCCTGEEPYSIAILLHRLIRDARDWNVTILGTDLNPRFLEAASQGVYGKWSLRNTPSRIRERYFTKVRGGRLELLPEIRSMVRFEYLNLAEDVYPSLANNTNAMDIVLCRNVLMYFAPEAASRVIRNLSRCMRDGGWLAVSPVETSRRLLDRFSAVTFPDTILYRSSGSQTGGEAPADSPSPPWEAPRSPTQSAPVSPPEVIPAEPDAAVRPDPLSPRPGRRGDPPQPSFEDARAEYERGDYDAAAATLTRWMTDHPADAQAMALFARVHANRGRLDDAAAWCERAAAADKLNPALHYLQATVAQEQGKTGKAERSLRRAIYLEPEFVVAHFALGTLARRGGRAEESERHFRNARGLAARLSPEEILPESDGITAGRLARILDAMGGRSDAA